MSDFIRRPLEGVMGLVQGDIDQAFGRQRRSIDAASSYSPADASDWAGTPPTTVAEAIDRLVAAVAAGSTSV